MSINQVSVHLDILGQNPAGSVFISTPVKLAVLRWERHVNLVHMIALVQMAHTEMTACGADTLVYDMRRLPNEEGLINDVMARIQALSNNMVRRVGCLSLGAGKQAIHPDVAKTLEQKGVQACAGTTFDEIGRALDAMEAPGLPHELIMGKQPVGFNATYAGSWYSLPELNVTVIRTSGNTIDPALSTELFSAAFALHKESGASAVILDSSATPTISDLSRYIHVYQDFIVPLGTSGLFKQAIHVRAGDQLFAEGAPPAGPLITSFGVPFYEVAMMSDALILLHMLQGKTRPVDAVRTIPSEARY
jgi:hypothetical protein